MSRTLEEILRYGWDGQPAPKSPEDGDPELLPKPEVYRPSTERMPYDAGGRAIEPELPVGFMRAPDVADLPWIRRRGDEWTDADMRAVALAWIAERFRADPLLTRWEIVETATGVGTHLRTPALLVRLWRGETVRETSAPVSRELRSTYGIRIVLASFEPYLSFQ